MPELTIIGISHPDSPTRWSTLIWVRRSIFASIFLSDQSRQSIVHVNQPRIITHIKSIQRRTVKSLQSPQMESEHVRIYLIQQVRVIRGQGRGGRINHLFRNLGSLYIYRLIVCISLFFDLTSHREIYNAFITLFISFLPLKYSTPSLNGWNMEISVLFQPTILINIFTTCRILQAN